MSSLPQPQAVDHGDAQAKSYTSSVAVQSAVHGGASPHPTTSSSRTTTVSPHPLVSALKNSTSFLYMFPLDRSVVAPQLQAVSRIQSNSFYVKASCDGLLILSKGDDLFVCNPTTSQIAPIGLGAFDFLGFYSHLPTGDRRPIESVDDVRRPKFDGAPVESVDGPLNQSMVVEDRRAFVSACGETAGACAREERPLAFWLKLYQLKATRSIRGGTSGDPLACGEVPVMHPLPGRDYKNHASARQPPSLNTRQKQSAASAHPHCRRCAHNSDDNTCLRHSPCLVHHIRGGATHTAGWGSCPSYCRSRDPPPPLSHGVLVVVGGDSIHVHQPGRCGQREEEEGHLGWITGDTRLIGPQWRSVPVLEDEAPPNGPYVPMATGKKTFVIKEYRLLLNSKLTSLSSFEQLLAMEVAEVPDADSGRHPSPSSAGSSRHRRHLLIADQDPTAAAGGNGGGHGSPSQPHRKLLPYI
ncbi:hypothetical protein HU200_048068 [Digitaria exilis]|uniref:Uncharacterized protein n=1 Tax=Digitaria exilis TaxID=1010633 RepID=A0A835EB69_9POAL|nr:hypothetical protein HU200_048068 [Digitaria exilis]